MLRNCVVIAECPNRVEDGIRQGVDGRVILANPPTTAGETLGHDLARVAVSLMSIGDDSGDLPWSIRDVVAPGIGC